MFAGQTAWHVPWMKRVLPVIFRIARAFPARTILTRFIPPVPAEEAEGVAAVLSRWNEFTRERLPRIFLIAPGIGGTDSPAQVVDKHFYSPFSEPELHQAYRIAKLIQS